MKSTLLLVAALAATIGSAAAQGSRTAGANTGGSTSPANGNNNVSSGNSTNTSSSAANSNPTTASPNYKPAATRPGTGASAKPTTKKTPGTVVSSGGQGHNSTPDPKGKILVAPSATTSGKGSSKK
jgi:cytoskeletal protein RodZ